MNELSSKVAVVTGAGSGIGRAIATGLAARGCVLALIDINRDSLDVAASDLRAAGTIVSCHTADVSDEASVRSAAEEVTGEHGHVNILVNNAGVVALGRFEEASLDDFRWVAGINAWGVVYGCKYFLPHMPSGDAHVVNMASAAGIYAEPGRSAYAFTKFAVRGFSEALRLELAERDIGVTAVYPGIIKTNIAASTRTTPATSGSDGGAAAVKAHPPEDVAKKVITAIEKNKARALVGPETYLLDFGCRLMPTLFPRIVKRATKS